MKERKTESTTVTLSKSDIGITICKDIWKSQSFKLKYGENELTFYERDEIDALIEMLQRAKEIIDEKETIDENSN